MKHKITVLPQNRIILADENSLLSYLLIENGFLVSSPCGGNGKCGKCKVKLINGEVCGAEMDENRMVKSCLARIKEDIAVELTNDNKYKINISNIEKVEPNGEYGVTVDIGTTTVSACLVDLKSGVVLKKATCFNPQDVFGSDVLSRITAAGNGNLLKLQALILNQISEILNAFSQYGKIPLKKMTVAANTTMLHLFLGVDPTPMGAYPFTPVFTKTRQISGEELGLNVQDIILLPSVSAYIGADITAGILATGIHMLKETALLVDIGTNGEIVLSHNGELYAASTAAGPAIEGASMQCGMSGVSGAINSVILEKGLFKYKTIDNAPAVGICGSGYVDLIALLLKENIIDEYGAFNYASDSVLTSKLNNDNFYLTDNVFLSRRDIAEFQLAKAAICTGIKALIYECNIDISQINRLYLAGGMGYYINLHNAVAVGMLPPYLANKALSTENTAIEGAKKYLLDNISRQEICQIAHNTKTVELAFSEFFQKEYITSMLFRFEKN